MRMPTRRDAEERKPSPSGSRKREPDDHVRRSGSACRWVEQLGDVAGVVLAVAVDLNGDLVAVLVRVDVAGLHRAADAEVERQPQHRAPRPRRALRGAVRRAVVDDEHVELGRPLVDLGDRRGDGFGLVEGGDDGEIAAQA